jgi:acetolactate synthase-1/2/3 large subunit
MPAVLRAMIAPGRGAAQQDREADLPAWWRADRRMARQEVPELPASDKEIIKPQHAVRACGTLTKDLNRETFISTEVGQHQMWAAQYFGISSSRTNG